MTALTVFKWIAIVIISGFVAIKVYVFTHNSYHKFRVWYSLYMVRRGICKLIKSQKKKLAYAEDYERDGIEKSIFLLEHIKDMTYETTEKV